MSEYEEIRDKLNTIIQFCKANIKLCKGFADYLSNVSVKVDGELENLRKTVDEIKDEVLKLNKLRETEKRVYSDEEIYRLKKVMSWCRLSEKTEIPLSTLQYRHKRYIKKLSADQDTAGVQD
ncbi:MAG: hypothetical protein NC299_09275 [Lachnospiraceae bacterium]|nr:hypothetical protein [Ruminococcus sp.]MCM1275544.1 hypothetical protein [Lachnospiraceae bacterium]